MDFSQRAADGGIGAGWTWSEWASEGELKGRVGEPESGLRYQREHMSVCMSGCRSTSSRVAPQEFWMITALVPAFFVRDKGCFLLYERFAPEESGLNPYCESERR